MPSALSLQTVVYSATFVAGSPDDAARKCCNVLNLGECPEWIDGLETCATPGQGATPAQQSWDIIDRLRSEGDYDPSEDLVRDPVCRSAIEEIVALRVLVDEAEHGRAVAVATLSEQLDAANARVAALEAECLAVRRVRDTPRNSGAWEYVKRRDLYDAARAATGPIGGVA